MNIKIIVATHKLYQMPKDDMYVPLHVGAEGKKDLGYTKDNTGINISQKNPFWCELTGLYWAWNNLDYDYLGLVHYRRHFKSKNGTNSKFNSIITKKELENILQKTDIIVPKKRYYIIETLYSHYKHTHFIEDLDKTRNIIEKKYPTYLKYFDLIMNRRYGHMFNMFIMKKDKISGYCNFIFDILFELEKETNPSIYDKYQARLYGYISELLLDVWIEKNNLSFKEIPILSMEKTNWIKKGSSFLMAKFLGKKYDRSF